VTWQTASDAGLAGWDRSVQDTVRKHPAQHLHGQMSEQEGQWRHVLSGSATIRISGSLPGCDEPLDEVRHLPRRYGDGVLAWC
jgi:hypothetical protein